MRIGDGATAAGVKVYDAVTDSQQGHAILDWYHPSLLFFILATYVLSGIDAILTVTLLEIGAAEEANPFMHWLLAEDVRLFAGVKALVTGIGLVWLAAYSNQFLFNKFRVNRIVYALFAVYSLLHQIRMLVRRLAKLDRCRKIHHIRIANAQLSTPPPSTAVVLTPPSLESCPSPPLRERPSRGHGLARQVIDNSEQLSSYAVFSS